METHRLGTLDKGTKGRIIKLEQSEMTDQLLEMGFVEGAEVKIVHEAPVSKDPIAVQVRGALVALRRSEANLIHIGPLKSLEQELQNEQ